MPIGPIMLDIAGLELSEADIKLLQNPLVGGVILFDRNYDNLNQLRQLVYNIRNCRKNPILIAVDQEGGRVQRFIKDFTRLPPNRLLGELFDIDKNKALNYAEQIGWLMASEILAAGIDLSFAPVLDIDTDSNSIIKTRGFHYAPNVLTEIAQSYIDGMHMAGMASTGKHFPGHGTVNEDSHVELPNDYRTIQEIGDNDLSPFASLVHDLNAIMPAHIVYPKIDEFPASFSKIWLQEILRHELFFNGAIFSDDLSMKGAEIIGDYVSRTKAALFAGCDMVLICNQRDAINDVLDALKNYQNSRSEQRLLKLCGHFHITREELLLSNEWKEAEKIARDLNDRKYT